MHMAIVVMMVPTGAEVQMPMVVMVMGIER